MAIRISRRVQVPLFFAMLALYAVSARAQEPVNVAPTPASNASSGSSTATGNLADIPPVVRPIPGNWGMTFSFGGLAPLSVGGLNTLSVNNLLFTEIGVRAVLSQIVIPFSFGFGTAVNTPSGAGTTADFGISMSGGVLKGFRVWRRIAPYFGGAVHLQYTNDSAANNYLFNLSLGPLLGIEFFIADRVSLFMQGLFAVGLDFSNGSPLVSPLPPGTVQTTTFTMQTVISGGGQMGLTFYF